LVPASWLAAALGLSVGLWHVAVRGLPGAVPFVLPLGVLGAALAIGLTRRPPLVRAARVADTWFGGMGLMTAALDQLGRPREKRAAAADFVLARAEMAALHWGQRLRRASPPLGLRRTYLPLAILALASVLHSLPGAAPASIGRGAPGGSDEPVGRQAAPGRILGDLGSPASTDTNAGPRRSPQPSPEPARGAVLPPDGDTIAGEASGGEPRLPGGAAADTGAGTAPGTASPRPRRERPGPETVPLPIEYFELRRSPGDRGRSEAPLGSESLEIPGAPASGRVPAARLDEGPARPDLSPQLRAYVDAVLRASGDEE
jgi:hypothetical protein